MSKKKNIQIKICSQLSPHISICLTLISWLASYTCPGTSKSQGQIWRPINPDLKTIQALWLDLQEGPRLSKRKIDKQHFKSGVDNCSLIRKCVLSLGKKNQKVFFNMHLHLKIHINMNHWSKIKSVWFDFIIWSNIISMIKIQIHMKFILKTHIENTSWFFSTSASVCCFLGHLWYLAQYTDWHA